MSDIEGRRIELRSVVLERELRRTELRWQAASHELASAERTLTASNSLRSVADAKLRHSASDPHLSPLLAARATAAMYRWKRGAAQRVGAAKTAHAGKARLQTEATEALLRCRERVDRAGRLERRFRTSRQQRREDAHIEEHVAVVTLRHRRPAAATRREPESLPPADQRSAPQDSVLAGAIPQHGTARDLPRSGDQRDGAESERMDRPLANAHTAREDTFELSECISCCRHWYEHSEAHIELTLELADRRTALLRLSRTKAGVRVELELSSGSGRMLAAERRSIVSALRRSGITVIEEAQR